MARSRFTGKSRSSAAPSHSATTNKPQASSHQQAHHSTSAAPAKPAAAPAPAPAAPAAPQQPGMMAQIAANAASTAAGVAIGKYFWNEFNLIFS